jgi:hypothetical protein
LGGSVNSKSIDAIDNAGYYNEGPQPGVDWADGDFLGLGQVGSKDIEALIGSGNYGGPSFSALLASLASPSGSGNSGDAINVGNNSGVPYFVYDAATGDHQLHSAISRSHVDSGALQAGFDFGVIDRFVAAVKKIEQPVPDIVTEAFQVAHSFPFFVGLILVSSFLSLRSKRFVALFTSSAVMGSVW